MYGEADSRFGFSLSSAGDVNLDGFEDLAIGAPYQEDGVVFLFHGSKDGIGEKPSQEIKVSEGRYGVGEVFALRSARH